MSAQQPLEALKKEGDSAFWLNKEPRCPHCGYDIDVGKHDLWRIYAEDTHEIDCPSCELAFKVKSSVSYKFSTDNQEED